MRKAFVLLVICCFSLGFIDQSHGQNISEPQKSKIETTVDSVFHSMIKAAERLDYDYLSRGVNDEYHAGFITNAGYFARFDSLTNYAKIKSQGIAKQTITLQNEKMTVISDDIVLLTATGEANVDVNIGNSFMLKFYWSFVYKKAGSDWKVIQSHQSVVR
jgi:hypothetical protein